jgi:hypothetical protein
MLHGYNSLRTRYARVMDIVIKRRSRMVRDSRSSGRLELTRRDLDVLQLLARYRYLRSTFIEAFVGGNSTVLRWRLRDLFDAGYVRRPLQQWQFANARYVPVVYALGEKGRAVLEELGLAARVDSQNGANFSHQVMIDETMASIEIALTRRSGFKLIGQSEILERLPSDALGSRLRLQVPQTSAIVPDAMFGVRGPAGVVLYALEVDRESEPVRRSRDGTSYEGKITRYNRLIEEGHYRRLLGTAAPLVVLHVTLSEKRMRKLLPLSDRKPFHAFKVLQGVNGFGQLPGPSESLVSEPWTRAALSTYSLLQ